MRKLVMRKLVLTICATLIVPQVAGAGSLSSKPPMALGTAKPAFRMVTADGESPSWARLQAKVVIFDFWATWCIPCLRSFPNMNALKQHYLGKPVQFYSVTYEDAATVAPVLIEHPLITTVAYDNDFSTFRSFGAWAIPVVYVFDAHGRLAAEVNGAQLNPAVIDAPPAGQYPSVPQQMAWADPAGAEQYFRALKAKAAGRKP
jgi:thiol-disulfide isomerase/thioredoxin